MADLAIKAVITAVDRITAPIRKIAATMKDRLGGGFKSLMGAIGGTIGKLSDLTLAATKWAAVGGLALTVAAGAAGMAWLDAAGDLDDFARQAGVTVEAMQELRYAAQLSGVGSEVLGSALQGLNKGLGQARAGTGKLAGFLGKVSPALLKQVKAAKSTDEAFTLVVQAMQQIPDAGRRAALATAAFGGAGAEIARMADDGAEGIAKLREEFRQSGAEMSGEQVTAAAELGDQVDRLKLSMLGVANSIAVKLVPILGPLVEKLTAWITANRDIIGQKMVALFRGIGEALDRIDWPRTIQAVKDFAAGLVKAWDAIGGLKGAAVGYASLMAVQLVPAISAAIPAVKALISGFRLLWVTMMANPIIAVIALLTTAIALVIANWSDFEEFGAELWRTLKQLWADGTKNLTEFWAELSRTATQVWTDFSTWITGLWDGIVGVFDAAWQKIAAIVARVQGAVGTVIDGARKVTDFLGITDEAPAASSPRGALGPAAALLGPAASLPGTPALAAAAGAGAARAEVSGGVRVTFDNAPPGLRVAETSSGTPGMSVAASVGRRSLAMGAPL